MAASVRRAAPISRRASGRDRMLPVEYPAARNVNPRTTTPSGAASTVGIEMTTTARRWAADAALAALVIGVELTMSFATLKWHGGAASRPGPFGIILLVTGGIALLARRRYPGAALAVVLGATLGAGALGVHFA